MSSLTAPREKGAGATGRTRLSFLNSRWARSAAVYAVLLVMCALAAYWSMFSQFRTYDDEGFFEYSVHLFASGHPLYSSVFSPYGPAYYVVFGSLFALIGHVSTDSGRFVELFAWLACTFGLGLTAHRLTGRLSIGVAALGTAFFLLEAFDNEPMHPAVLVCLLLVAIVVVTAFMVARWCRFSLCAIGVLTAALLMTKINVGIYAFVSIAFAAVMAGPALVRHVSLRWLAQAAFVLVGPVVMSQRLNTNWGRYYAILAVLSALSLVFVATPPQLTAGEDDSRAWAAWLLGGFVACSAIVLLIVFALGTSPHAYVQDTIVVASHQADVFTRAITLSGEVVWWSLAASGLAWTLRRHGIFTGEPSAVSGIMRILAGVAILLSLGDQFPFGLGSNAPFALAMPLAWVAALPSHRDAPGSRFRLVRLLIPALAILQALLAYPVAGSQLELGSILFVLCGAVCLADGWFDLRSTRLPSRAGAAAGSGVTALFVVLALGTTFQFIEEPLQGARDTYRTGIPLAIAGATRLHLPAPQAVAFTSAVQRARRRCSTLIELPGLYSFNIWTNLPTPSPMTGEQPYWGFLSRAQQHTVLIAAERSPRLCLIRDDADVAFYTGGGPPPRVPLVAYLEDRFAPLARYGDYTLEVRRTGAVRQSATRASG